MLLRNNLSEPYSDATIDILSLDIYGCNALSVNKAPRSSGRPSTNETTHPVATVAAPDRVAKAGGNLIRRYNYADVVRQRRIASQKQWRTRQTLSDEIITTTLFGGPAVATFAATSDIEAAAAILRI